MSGEGYLASQRSLVEGVGRGDLKFAYGSVTPSAGSQAVATGLSVVLAAVANSEGAPGAGVGDVAYATAEVGDQAGTPAAGSILVKSWQDDFSAASANFLQVNWVAIGY